MDGTEESRERGGGRLSLKKLIIEQIQATEKNTEMLSRVLTALENLDDTQGRMIKRDSALTGILSRTQEMQELRAIKREGMKSGNALKYIQRKRCDAIK